MLGAAQPVYVAWGPELTSLYNDGYLPIVGAKHPGLGQPFATLWAEIWDAFRPIVEATLRGEAQHFVDLPVALAGRPGLPVGYFTFSYTPLREEDGRIAGFYVAATETTERVLAERQREALLHFLAFPDSVRSVMGYALGLAQFGGKHPHAKPWKGEGPGVFEIVESQERDAYRALYTVRFEGAVYVLHAFQKKSPSGIRTATSDVELVRERLRRARQSYEDQR